MLFICSIENNAADLFKSTDDMTNATGTYTARLDAGPSSVQARADIEPSNIISRIISEYFNINTASRIEPEAVAST